MCMRSTDEDVIAERRHEELIQMKLERIVRKATPARSQSKVMKAFCDPDLHYLVTPDDPANLEDESEEEYYDEDLADKGAWHCRLGSQHLSHEPSDCEAFRPRFSAVEQAKEDHIRQRTSGREHPLCQLQ